MEVVANIGVDLQKKKPGSSLFGLRVYNVTPIGTQR